MWMLASLMLAGISSCADADSELTDAVTQSDGKTRAYDYSCTLTLEEPGTLGTLLEEKMGENAGNVQELIISGKFSSTDKDYIRNNLRNVLVRVDMSGVTSLWKQNGTHQDDDGNTVIDWEETTTLFSSCFNNMAKLEEIKLPEGLITEIDDSAFRDCVSLVEISLPEGIILIKRYLFAGCTALQRVNLPNSLQTMESEIFLHCYALPEAEIPAGVTSMGGSVFCNCEALKSVKIKANISRLPQNTFYGCYSLTDVELSDAIQSIGEGAFSYCTKFKDPKLLTDYTLDESSIFRACGYEEADLSNHTTIPHSLLMDCVNLKKVTLSPDLIKIDDSAFQNTTLLTSIDLPASIKVIGYNAFNGSGIENIDLPEGMTELGYGAFSESQIRSITVPSTLEKINGYFCSGCKRLTAVIWNNESDVPYLGINDTNCILYIKSYDGRVPAFDPDLRNVVIDDVAEVIILKSETQSNFGCPKSFTAKKITYSMEFYSSVWTYNTPGYSKGWKTITLPFTPSRIYHEEKGTLAPFNSDVEDAKPFWLRDLKNDSFDNVTQIEPNHPYIIAMPYNPDLYLDEYNISGIVTFEATNALISATGDLAGNKGTDMTMWPNYTYKEGSNDYYGLDTSYPELDHLSVFRTGLSIYPFQAYVTSATARSIITMEGKRAATRAVSNDPRLKQPGKPRIDDI
jgi:hypothetical protein